jgi:lipid A 3-O-deacylase
MKSRYKKYRIQFFTGMFDFSDDGKQSAILVGFQHQNENLNRDTFLGNLSPITGGMITADNASAYIYTGVQAQYGDGWQLILLQVLHLDYIMRVMEKT